MDWGQVGLIDLHCDTVSRLYDRPGGGDLRENNLHVDLQKLETAGVEAQFFALFPGSQCPEPGQRVLDLLEFFGEELDRSRSQLGLARDLEELDRIVEEGKIAAFLTIEGGEALTGELEVLRDFYRRGVRLLTLTWNHPNALGYPNAHHKGLTPFGREVIAAMNEWGMIVDVSHLSDAGFFAAAEASTAPIVASHSNARALCGHPRNLTDQMIRTVAESGGVVGLNFCASFLGEDEVSRVEDIVRHALHIRRVGGRNVLALGTDFDGINCSLEIENMARMDRLLSALRAGGLRPDEIEDLMRNNVRRVIGEVLG